MFFDVYPNSIAVYNETGVRFVINLKTDTEFTFTGSGEVSSMTNPYVVE